MKEISFGKSGLRVPAVVVGCMRLSGLEGKEQEKFVGGALDLGLNFFDHADIYGRGECERAFGRAVRSLGIARDRLFIQSKCGIVPGVMFDFSAKHILEAVDGILSRLGTDYLDSLLLHRPDALVEPEEVARAFDALEKAGKVRRFGVSNMNPAQIALLKTCVRQDIEADQLQFSPIHASMISAGTEVNMQTEGAVSRDGYVLDYCRLNKITVQAWSPFQYGFFEGVYLNNDKFEKLNAAIGELSEKYGIEGEGAVTAWILRHPADMQMITGTMNLKRLTAIRAGADVQISREEWYKIYMAAGHILP